MHAFSAGSAQWDDVTSAVVKVKSEAADFSTQGRRKGQGTSAMTQTNKPELDLYVASHEDCTHTWVLDPPPGRNSFRIVVHCRRAQHVPLPKPHSRSGYFGAIAHLLLMK